MESVLLAAGSEFEQVLMCELYGCDIGVWFSSRCLQFEYFIRATRYVTFTKSFINFGSEWRWKCLPHGFVVRLTSESEVLSGASYFQRCDRAETHVEIVMLWETGRCCAGHCCIDLGPQPWREAWLLNAEDGPLLQQTFWSEVHQSGALRVQNEELQTDFSVQLERSRPSLL